MKKIGVFLGITIVLIFSLELILRLLNQRIGVENQIQTDVNNSILSDSILGWKFKEGSYIFSINNNKTFTVHIDSNGCRVSSSKTHKNFPKIHIYGCSYTFGYSVDDTATFCSRLQMKLPEYQICNKGVPGYGLTQMYLSFKHSLLNNDTPQIAILNYAHFHDMRTVYHYQHISTMLQEIKTNSTFDFNKFLYPYFSLEKDNLTLKYATYSELKKYPFCYKYSTICTKILDTYYAHHDNSMYSKLHTQSLQIIELFVELCKKNNITPIIANILPPSRELSYLCAENNILTLNYKVPIFDEKYTSTRYNNGPVDPWHPSPLAHQIYADSLYYFLKRKI